MRNYLISLILFTVFGCDHIATAQTVRYSQEKYHDNLDAYRKDLYHALLTRRLSADEMKQVTDFGMNIVGPQYQEEIDRMVEERRTKFLDVLYQQYRKQGESPCEKDIWMCCLRNGISVDCETGKKPTSYHCNPADPLLCDVSDQWRKP
jgi:hypothetical protein